MDSFNSAAYMNRNYKLVLDEYFGKMVETNQGADGDEQ